jgi:hypothetical protein
LRPGKVVRPIQKRGVKINRVNRIRQARALSRG